MQPFRHVLVIDDDRDFCSLLSLVVKREGLSADCSYTLEESAKKIQDQHSQLIILDNNLPDGKGIEFYIANKMLFKDSLVLMITADPTTGLQKYAIDQGVAVFLSKPLLLKEFKKIIQRQG